MLDQNSALCLLACAGPEQRPMSAGLCWTRTTPYVCWPVLDQNSSRPSKHPAGWPCQDVISLPNSSQEHSALVSRWTGSHEAEGQTKLITAFMAHSLTAYKPSRLRGAHAPSRPGSCPRRS